MLIASIVFIALTAILAAMFVMELAAGRPAAVTRRLAEMEHAAGSGTDILKRRRRQAQAERLTAIIEGLGERLQDERNDLSELRLRMIQAGFPNANAVPLYLGARIGVPLAVATAIFMILPLAGVSWVVVLLGMVWGGALGYVLPTFYVGARVKRRQKEMRKALPDALDMMVVCVEAGLGLNQAIVRVAEEIERLSPVLSEQFALVNLEIRAGTARDEALRNLGERTGLDDIKSLTAMLIQTDRFGTSIAQALRVQADTLRTKRRQRAEEAAAKTTIKLVFPLVIFIFPAMFVVILGPALIQIFEALGNFRQ